VENTTIMTFSQIIDYSDFEPVHFRKLKKTVPDGNNGWEERTFVVITKDVSEARQWLQQHYGESKYSDTWWYSPGSIVMSEKIYTHYALSV